MKEEPKNLALSIKTDLLESGFGSEMKAIKDFWEQGWESYGSQNFFDLDEGKSREYDVLASQRMIYELKNGKHCIVFYDIVSEVKKTSKPWVVFRHNPNYEDDLEVGWSDVMRTKLNLPASGPDLVNIFEETSLARLNGWKGYGIHESFKKPDRASQWYSAFVTACKAAWHQSSINDLSEPEDLEQEYDAEQSSRLHIVKPVVNLDGLLYLAQLNESNETEVMPIDWASISFNFETSNYFDEWLRVSHVDVITLAKVQEFAKLCTKRQEMLLDKLVALLLGSQIA